MKIEIALSNGWIVNFNLTPHSERRRIERNIQLNEIKEVLIDRHSLWKKINRTVNPRYAIIGNTISGRKIKIVVEKESVAEYLIITLIDENT